MSEPGPDERYFSIVHGRSAKYIIASAALIAAVSATKSIIGGPYEWPILVWLSLAFAAAGLAMGVVAVLISNAFVNKAIYGESVKNERGYYKLEFFIGSIILISGLSYSAFVAVNLSDQLEDKVLSIDIIPSKSVVKPGEVVAFSTAVAGSSLSYSFTWRSEPTAGRFLDTDEPSVEWIAPSQIAENEQIVRVYVDAKVRGTENPETFTESTSIMIRSPDWVEPSTKDLDRVELETKVLCDKIIDAIRPPDQASATVAMIKPDGDAFDHADEAGNICGAMSAWVVQSKSQEMALTRVGILLNELGTKNAGEFAEILRFGNPSETCCRFVIPAIDGWNCTLEKPPCP